MTQQIKFRGFRTDGKGWVEGFYAKLEINAGEIDHVIFEPTEPVFQSEGVYLGTIIHPESLGMFTGQPDKNGREIVGAIGEKGGDVIAIGDFVLFVKFENCSFRLFSSAIKNSDGNPLRWGELSRIWDLGYQKSIEIIGNQFETK
jgi:hypothetical protein